MYLPRIRVLVCWNQSESYVFQTPNRIGDRIEMLQVYDKIIRKNKLYETDNKIITF